MAVTLDPPFVDRASSTRPTKTIAILGAAYGGARAAKLISDSLPEGWRLVVVERNSHFNHVYAFPRYSVVPKHAPKAFIPYINHLKLTTPPAKIDATKSLPTPPLTPTSSTEDLNEKKYYDARVWIQGSITKLTPHSVTFTRPSRSIALGSSEHSNVETGSGRGHGVFNGPEETIHFDYAIYALGAGLPDPSNVWNEHPGNNPPKEVVHDHVEHGLGSKRHGVKWMQHRGEMYEKAGKILIVGGGALGIQLASDIKYSYPDKNVTLLHSRERLLPIYPIEMHDQLLAGLKRLQVNVVLGQRVTEWPEDPEVLDGAVKVTRTNKGSVFESDLVLPCTGQKPHSQLMGSISPSFLSEKNCRIRVTPTLQITSDPAKSVNPDSIIDPLEIVRRLDAMSLSHSTPPSSPASSSRNRENDDGAERDIDMSHFFAVGDCADTGAIQAGHTAYWQGEAAARNILRLIKKEESGGKIDEPLEVYKSGAPAIKVTMGLDRGIISNAEGTKESMDAHEDLNARLIWDSKGSSHLPDDA